MKNINYVLCMLLSMATALTSCLGSSDSEVTLYNDAVITSFTLGTLTQYKPGTDSVVATITGSDYPMSIDQLECKIYNRTPLPTGTRINNVLCTVNSLNNGIVSLQDLTDGLFTIHSSETGVDFQEKNTRKFRVFASDASFFRDYAVTIHVATSSGDNLSWGKAVADTTLLQGYANMKLAMLKGKRLVALCSNGTNTLVRFSFDNGATWKKPDSETLLADSAWATATVKDSTLFLLSGGQLYTTTDGEQWNSSTAADGLKQLVAASKGQLFALCNDSTLKVSADDGITWTADRFDESLTADSAKHLLALKGIASTCFDYTASYHTQYLLLMGNNGSNTVIWNRLSHYDPIETTDAWSNIPAESINHDLLPMQQRLSLVYYDNSLLAFGDGTTVYQSTDQGITWRSNATYKVPEVILTVTVDGDGRLCAIGQSGKVYRATKY